MTVAEIKLTKRSGVRRLWWIAVYRMVALVAILAVAVLIQQASVVRSFRWVPSDREGNIKPTRDTVISSDSLNNKTTEQQEYLIYGTKISERLETDDFNTSEATIHMNAPSHQQNQNFATSRLEALVSFNRSEPAIESLAQQHQPSMTAATDIASIPLLDTSKKEQQINTGSFNSSFDSSREYNASLDATVAASLPLHYQEELPRLNGTVAAGSLDAGSFNNSQVQSFNATETASIGQEIPNATQITGQLETSSVNNSQASLGSLQANQVSNNTTAADLVVPLDKPVQPQRLNATQLVELLNAGTLNMSQAPLIFPKPPSDSYEISSIYSRTAWLKLRNMLMEDSNEVILCVSGGSSSTGTPNTETRDRYHQLFGSAFRNVTVVDRAHGARNGMHTVQLMHSFLPKRTDIIFWEFSINDAVYFQLTNQTIKIMEARNQLILWLDQVARVTRARKQATPPLVILVYLWNPGYFVNSSGWPHYMDYPNFHYRATQGVAENYDFVVGHVNVGSYFDHLWEHNVTQTHFLADPTHPNTMAHRVIYHLLHDFVTDEQRKERPRTDVSQAPSSSHRPSISWACGDETSQKRLLRDLLLNKYPIADFTVELPKNDALLSGMLLPLVGEGSLTLQNLAKTNAIRSDRKYSATVPCCNNGTSFMSFDDIWTHGVLQGIQLSSYPDSNGLTVYFDDENVTDKLIDCSNATEWKCNLSDVYKILYYWVVLEAERNVSSLALCNHLSTCGNSSQDLSVQSVTVYGVSKLLE